jgi:hypothetical protein
MDIKTSSQEKLMLSRRDFVQVAATAFATAVTPGGTPQFFDGRSPHIVVSL